jgi:hypothetical protein
LSVIIRLKNLFGVNKGDASLASDRWDVQAGYLCPWKGVWKESYDWISESKFAVIMMFLRGQRLHSPIVVGKMWRYRDNERGLKDSCDRNNAYGIEKCWASK